MRIWFWSDHDLQSDFNHMQPQEDEILRSLRFLRMTSGENFTEDSKLETRNPEPGTLNPELGTRNSEL